MDSLKPQYITPCTLSMLNKSTTKNDIIHIYDKPVETVEIYARTLRTHETALRHEIDLFDEYTKYQLIIYKKNSEDQPRSLQNYKFVENGYVRIIGSFRFTQNQKILSVISLENETSRESINYHYSKIITIYAKAYPDLVLKSKILQALKSHIRLNGLKATEISEFLENKHNPSLIEEKCIELTEENLLKLGVDWEHYKLA